jgi:hypothetical protein
MTMRLSRWSTRAGRRKNFERRLDSRDARGFTVRSF